MLQGVKLGDMQATVQGFLSTGLFFVISNSTPLPTLSAERPHPTIFSLYVFLSVLGQAAVHLALLVSFYFGALRLMPEVCLSMLMDFCLWMCACLFVWVCQGKQQCSRSYVCPTWAYFALHLCLRYGYCAHECLTMSVCLFSCLSWT